jgi:hypothetical protein
MAGNSTHKVNKWDDRGSNPDPLHNNANVHHSIMNKEQKELKK